MREFASKSLINLIVTSIWILFDRTSATNFSIPDVIPCLTISKLKGPYRLTDLPKQRIVAIGDIHGDYDGLLEILFTANITESISSCIWRNQIGELNDSSVGSNKEEYTGTLVVQTGDVVDRGPNTLLCFGCLESLQKTAPRGSKVVRLLGNHDILWLEGEFWMRNQDTDTPSVRSAVVKRMKKGILNGDIKGSFSHRIQGVPLLFVHAGLRSGMIEYITQIIVRGSSDLPISLASFNLKSYNSHDIIGRFINDIVIQTIMKCQDSIDDTSHSVNSSTITSKTCKFSHPIFEAGPDRGGVGIGGPFWTDYSILFNNEESSSLPVTQFIQIVGHTIHRGKITYSKFMGSICIDAGMYIGGRAFLEISPNSRFRAYEKQLINSKSVDANNWLITDITETVCYS